MPAGACPATGANVHRAIAATMTDRDHIQYEATITDPKTFSRPWKMSLPLYRHVNADARLGQFKCVEFVEELMFGHLRKTLAK